MALSQRQAKNASAAECGRYLHLPCVELLLVEVLAQCVPVADLLLPGELPQRVASDGAVVAGHAQGAAPLAGHAGEALPAGEVVDRHRIEAHLLSPRRRLVLSEDGGGCIGGGRGGGGVTEGRLHIIPNTTVMLS